jgi:hypothetical protein
MHIPLGLLSLKRGFVFDDLKCHSLECNRRVRLASVLTPRLAWIAEFQGSINRATGGQLKGYTVLSHADPLKAFVKFDLWEEMEGKNYHPFTNLAHGFAKANDCLLERVHRGESSLTLEVLLKRRIGPPMRVNPLLSKK